MSRCQQWISVLVSIVMTLLLMLTGVQRLQAQPAIGPMVVPKANQVRILPVHNATQGAGLVTNGSYALELLLKMESGKGIDNAEIHQENQQIQQKKQMVRQMALQKETAPPEELSSRMMLFSEYAQFQRAQLGQKVAFRAIDFIGKPYVWGGTTPSGFDCSGFTQYVLSTYGIKIPRNSYEQFNVGQPVPKDQLRPGDLVFFSTYAPGPSHLGIYIGGGKFVHALNHQTGVITSKLDTDYYKEHFVGARRVL